MSTSRVTPKKAGQLGAVSSNQVTMMTTPWMLAFGANDLRLSTEIQAVKTNYQQKLQWRTAAVSTDFPNAWVASATTLTGNGIANEDFDLSATTDQLWVQGGIAVGSSTGASEALVSLRGAVDGNACVIGARTIVLQPDLNDAKTAYFAIGNPVPQLGITAVMFAVIASGLSATLTVQPAVRTLDRTDEPTAWGTVGTAKSFTTTNDRWNSGTITSTAGAKMFIQPGIAITTAARGTLRVLVAAKY